MKTFALRGGKMIDFSARSVYNIVVKFIKAMKKQAFFINPLKETAPMG